MLRQRPITAPLGALLVLLAFSAVTLGLGGQPYMKSAATQLKKARAHLYAGEDDQAGHRARAMALTTAAIEEVNAGMKSDHHGAGLANEIFATETTAAAVFAGSHMNKALIHLKQAQTNLAAATPDAGGHHAKATDLIVKAIEEVEKAVAAS